MIKSELRKLIFNNRATISALMITAKQRDIISHVMATDSTLASEVASHFGMSISTASTQLGVLYSIGYLRRQKRIHDSGGVEYSYSAEIK